VTNFNQTHDPRLKSWVESANAAECDFPIQNLPFGIFSVGADSPRAGVAIGARILDLSVLEEAGLFNGIAGAKKIFNFARLNEFLSLGKPAWHAVRSRLSELLRHDNATIRDNTALRTKALVAMADARMHLPVTIPGYTDFYSSKEHATNVGSMFRDPKNALLPNWLHMPIGYNGRASSVVISGTPIRRPMGQLKLPDQENPIFAPCKKLDFELETAFIIGSGNALGEPISVSNAEDHIFGMVLMNDWSARDIQQWEYVPLGPFNAKTFGTSISPWIVTMEALEPFRLAGPAQEPAPLPYLQQTGANNYNIDLEVALKPANAKNATTICRTNFKHMYWSMAQQLAHHTVSGCNTQTGDLMGSGTISGTTPDSLGSLLELSWNGKNPVTVGGGITRTFIEDRDEIIISGFSQSGNYQIGFGDVRGVVLPGLSFLGSLN
jgi:fumarylacetoacetase